MIEYLSKRGRKWVRNLPPLVKVHFDHFYDMYDPQTNPRGLINMGTAESHLVDREIIDLIRTVTARMPLTGMDLHYNKFEGSEEFRAAIAAHWQNVIFGADASVRLTKEHVAACAGCTAALECLAMLLGDPGDVFLVPAPYYSSFVDDISERAGVAAVGVPNALALDRQAFEEAYAAQRKRGRRVRAVLFSSPNNPTGKVYGRKELENVLSFAMEHDLDVISDEIYAQTVFGARAEFISLLRLVPAHYRHRVHVTSSFAKDFVLSGFRTGFCLSFNPEIIRGFASLTYYSCVSTHTQALLTQLLKAPELPAVMALSVERLGKAYGIIERGLADIGVPILKAEAGIFVFADFSSYMQEADFRHEHILWEKIYHDLMINVSPGQLFGAEQPGWFRACYAFPDAAVAEACRRLTEWRL